MRTFFFFFFFFVTTKLGLHSNGKVQPGIPRVSMIVCIMSDLLEVKMVCFLRVRTCRIESATQGAGTKKRVSKDRQFETTPGCCFGFDEILFRFDVFPFLCPTDIVFSTQGSYLRSEFLRACKTWGS